uniref:Uncharacterized protein n=1 Tax=Timema douglasi TaxID=61478 RepID=A0A7R8Z7Z5_TIMDO|nr:unnamed protein product [Timema douglasi]
MITGTGRSVKLIESGRVQLKGDSEVLTEVELNTTSVLANYATEVAVGLNTTSALANYATEADTVPGNPRKTSSMAVSLTALNRVNEESSTMAEEVEEEKRSLHVTQLVVRQFLFSKFSLRVCMYIDLVGFALDGSEGPTEDAPPALQLANLGDPENSNSSSGEDHQPVLVARREPAGTKRKAEVLSKESGKIGVTITTSSPPPNKVPKLSTSSGKPSPPYSPQPVPVRRASSSSTKSNPETSRAKEDQTSRPPPVIGSKSREDLSQAYNRGPKSPSTFSLTPTLPGGGDKRPITVALTPATGHLQQEQVASLATSAPKEDLSKLKRSLSEGSAVVQRETLSAATVLPIQANQDSADKNLTSSSNTALTNTNIQCGNNLVVRPVHCDILDRQTHFLPHRVIKHPREVYRNPGAAYWLKRAPVADKVFITDVTVNLKTVTIRECKTEKGFFREREDSKQSDVL